jgi:hypothetical protein
MYFKNNFYSDGTDKFVVITVATEDNENLTRFRKSCSFYNVPYIVLGLGDDWKSGKAEDGVLLEPGGAQKIFYLKQELESWPELDDHIILFTDSYDVVLSASPKEILEKFRNTHSQILFSTEKTCWPDGTLESQYPETEGEYKFLNSGGFIGYANQVLEILKDDVKMEDDDQLYYTKKFFEYVKKDLEFIKLDYNQIIFQTLNLSIDDLTQDENGRFTNNISGNKPCIIHANGPSWVKKFLKEKSFYMFGEYDGSLGSINLITKSRLPLDKKIYIGLFLQQDLKNIDQVFDHIRFLSYPKENIILHIVYHKDEDLFKIERFINTFGKQYDEVLLTRNENFLDSRTTISISAKDKCDYLLLMDSNHIFRNNRSIQLLIEKELDFVTPMICEEGSQWVNFDIEPSYMKDQAREYKTKTIWIVDFVSGVYLIKNTVLDEFIKCLKPNPKHEDPDWDVLFSQQAKENGLILHLCNLNYYGGIIT